MGIFIVGRKIFVNLEHLAAFFALHTYICTRLDGANLLKS